MTDLTQGAAWMGGRILPIADAAISVTDWGVTHSDIAYDVVPVWQAPARFDYFAGARSR
ncbi:MAG: hypothetical protein AAF227_09460 [Pseudomonadota bacterium]